MNKFQSLFCAVCLLSGCASVQSGYQHRNLSDYANQEKLDQGLFGANDTLSEEAISKLLSSKVVLPKNIRLAVVRVSDFAAPLRGEMQILDHDIAKDFYAKNKWGDRIVSVIPVPQAMLSKPVTLANIRKSAALLQADAVVVVRPVSISDSKYRVFEKDTSKATTTIEVLLLDTRTSAVPFTSVITETAELPNIAADYNQYEMQLRAQTESEKRALLQVPEAIEKFIKTSM
jgi:hypothetical protein